jgi:hypothetical protein
MTRFRKCWTRTCNSDEIHYLISNFQVSWIRKSDSHILTVDHFSYINDDRFFVISPDDDDDDAGGGGGGGGGGKASWAGSSSSSTGSKERQPMLAAAAQGASEEWTLHIRFVNSSMLTKVC